MRRQSDGFSPRVILALVIVGVLAFGGLAVLSAYAPDLRGGGDIRGHALSPSAIGFKGAVLMLRAQETPVSVSRAKPGRQGSAQDLLVLTPQMATTAQDLKAFAAAERTLIVLPKWLPTPDPKHPGFVMKAGTVANTRDATDLLKAYAPETVIHRRTGLARTRLSGGGAIFAQGTWLPLGEIDNLQTLSGDGWSPALVDETGRMVLARSKRDPTVMVLAEPDLLNTQGLRSLDTARAGMTIVHTLRVGGPVQFDVTLSGYERGRGLLRLMLEPPWIAATLCGVAAMLLMGLHSLARFGPTRQRERELALGASGLIDNSAGLVRMAGREAEFAQPYAALTLARVLRAAGVQTSEDGPARIAEMARLRGVALPDALGAEAARAKTRDDLLAVARKLYQWKSEVTGGRH